MNAEYLHLRANFSLLQTVPVGNMREASELCEVLHPRECLAVLQGTELHSSQTCCGAGVHHGAYPPVGGVCIGTDDDRH